MATFGSFETEREVYSGHAYTVYSAKKTGDAKTEYAVKLFHLAAPDVEAASEAEVSALMRDIERTFLDRIALQKKAAEASRCVTPVLESGMDERGVWYVTQFYPRSVNRIISGRVALKRVDLEHIIRSMAQGALDLKRICGRSHGEILPTLIQISKSDELAAADVMLSDPLPGGAADAPHFELADLRAIGRILLQLVLRREMKRDEDFLILPILPTPEWKNIFGNDSARWLALCNRLLDPNLSVDQYGLEQLRAEIDALKPKRGVPPRVLISAAAVVVLGVVVVVILLRPKQQTIEITSDPPGATVLLDNQPQEGKTPLKLKLKKRPEPYAIEARQPEYRLLEQSTNWSGTGSKIHFQFPYGSVKIDSQPPGAEVRQDGTNVGKTPLTIPVLADGIDVKYELVMEGHAPQITMARIRKGVVTNLSESLPLLTEVGRVELTSTPSGAEVFLNGKPVSSRKTPTLVELKQGHYELTAVYKDWPAKRMPVDVIKSQKVPLNFDFDRGWVELDSDPSGASVWIGTNWMGDTFTRVQRPVGDTTFRFERAGFETTNLTVTVANQQTNRIKPVLLTTNGVFEFTADPATAAIFDSSGKQLGQTTAGHPISVTVAPDKPFTFTARTEGLVETNVTLTVKKRETKKYTFVFDYGTARFEGLPPGAAISAAGKPIEVSSTIVQRPGIAVSYHITATGYQPADVDVTVENRKFNYKSIPVKLSPEPVKVALSSDPPGAQFLVDGQPARASNGEYVIPWGPVTLVAQYPRLGSITNQATLVFDKPNNIPTFHFRYGTLLLTNLPTDLELYEGSQKIASANQGRPAYEPLGTHTYRYAPQDRFKPEQVTTNIVEGLNILFRPEIKGFLSGLANIQFAWVPSDKGGFWDGKTEKGFWVGVYEVTQSQYQQVIGSNPSKFQNDTSGNYPVEYVTWEQAAAFCEAMNSKDPKKPANWRYALPTDDQFTIFSEGSLEAGIIMSKSSTEKRTHPEPVGSTGKPNRFGLYDVVGNVSEWIDSPEKPAAGASYLTFSSQYRLRRNSGTAVSPAFGFRLVLVPQQ